MVNLDDIKSLTDFQRNTKTHIERLKKTGNPEILTINGEASLVVQDAKSYQKMLDNIEKQELVEKLAKRIESAESGEGIPAEQVHKEVFGV